VRVERKSRVEDRRSLIGIVGGVLPTVGGACCIGMGAGVATVGGAAGAALAWLTPLLLGAALVVAGWLLLRACSGRPWRRWHALVAVSAGSYVVSAIAVVPLLSAVLGGAGDPGGAPVLP
jgi:hypothetical protein